MENKKDIGKAFREKLDGLQKQPGNAAWDALKKDLPKKTPRFLPLFWIEASTAIKTVVVTLAALLVLLSGYFLLSVQDSNNSFSTPKNSSVNKDINSAGNSVNDQNNTSTHNAVKPNNEREVVGDDVNNSNEKSENENRNPHAKTLNNKAGGANTSATNTRNGKSNSANNNVSSGINNKKSGNTINSSTVTTLTKTSTVKNDRKQKDKRGNANFSITGKDEKSLNSAANKNKQLTNSSRLSNSKKNIRSLANDDSVLMRANDGKAKNTYSNRTNSKSETIDRVAGGISNDVSESITSENAIKLTDTISQISDSLCDVAVVNSIAVCKDTMEENTTKSNKAGIADFKRFYIFAYTAPTSFTLSNVLTPDSLLVSNATATKVSYNYGAYIGYNFNKKWSIRTGINVTGLQQTIKNAFLKNTYAVVPGSENEPNGYVHLIAPANYASINYTRNGSNAAVVQALGRQQGQATVNIIQKIEFAEVPVEVNYNVFGDKFGAGITAGLSTIFTTKNIVYAQNNEGTMWMGSNKNVKDIGFSTTIGLHFYYRPLPYLQINAEPVFKYYLNTFNNSHPYSYGLQAGLQYNFNFFGSKK